VKLTADRQRSPRTSSGRIDLAAGGSPSGTSG
jgi:hypothetical protein